MTIIRLKIMSTTPTHITIVLTNAHAAVRFRSQVRKNFLCNKTLKFFGRMIHEVQDLDIKASEIKSQYDLFCVLLNLDLRSLFPFYFLFYWPHSPPYLYKLQCCVLNLRIGVFKVKGKNFKNVNLGISLFNNDTCK